MRSEGFSLKQATSRAGPKVAAGESFGRVFGGKVDQLINVWNEEALAKVRVWQYLGYPHTVVFFERS